MPQPSERANAYLNEAEAGRIAAEQTDNPKTRAVFWDLAAAWQAMANQIEWPQAERKLG
jgi:hypothetical protein